MRVDPVSVLGNSTPRVRSPVVDHSRATETLFTYCTQVPHLSEHAAYGRIEAARAARSYPIILDLLAEGALTLTAIGLLRQHLTPENYREILEEARHKTKRETEELVARLRPRAAVPSRVRKLPSAKPAMPQIPTSTAPTQSSAPPPSPEMAEAFELVKAVGSTQKPPLVKPLAPERYKIQFTVSAETFAKLRQAQDLLRHTVPNGDPAEIFDRALTLLLEHAKRSKLAVTSRPRAHAAPATRSRHIPAAVRREVWARDGGTCAFVGAHGRCKETGFLEFHHVEPYATGGDTTSRNIQLRCRAHNAYESELFFGAGEPWMAREARVAYVTRSWTESQTASDSSDRARLAHQVMIDTDRSDPGCDARASCDRPEDALCTARRVSEDSTGANSSVTRRRSPLSSIGFCITRTC